MFFSRYLMKQNGFSKSFDKKSNNFLYRAGEKFLTYISSEAWNKTRPSQFYTVTILYKRPARNS